MTQEHYASQQFGCQIHPPARIGIARILPSRLIMEENTAIGHLTVAKSLLHSKAHATMGRGNWFTGFLLGQRQAHFISHTIDIKENRQTSRRISVGDYCFVGSNSVFLGGATFPNYCVLGAKSLRNKLTLRRTASMAEFRRTSSVCYRPIAAISTAARVLSSN